MTLEERVLLLEQKLAALTIVLQTAMMHLGPRLGENEMENIGKFVRDHQDMAEAASHTDISGYHLGIVDEIDTLLSQHLGRPKTL